MNAPTGEAGLKITTGEQVMEIARGAYAGLLSIQAQVVPADEAARATRTLMHSSVDEFILSRTAGSPISEAGSMELTVDQWQEQSEAPENYRSAELNGLLLARRYILLGTRAHAEVTGLLDGRYIRALSLSGSGFINFEGENTGERQAIGEFLSYSPSEAIVNIEDRGRTRGWCIPLYLPVQRSTGLKPKDLKAGADIMVLND